MRKKRYRVPIIFYLLCVHNNWYQNKEKGYHSTYIESTVCQVYLCFEDTDIKPKKQIKFTANVNEIIVMI